MSLEFMCIGGPAAGMVVPRESTMAIRVRVPGQGVVVYRRAFLTISGVTVPVWVPEQSPTNAVANLLAVYREHMATAVRPYFDVEF